MARIAKMLAFCGLTTWVLSLTACGDAIRELDDKLTYHASVRFVNALPRISDFYLKRRNISSGYNGLFDPRSAVARDIPSHHASEVIHYSYSAINNMLNLGVKDSINNNQPLRINTTLQNADKLWVVAWQDSTGRHLTVLPKQKHNANNTINVRLFSNGSYTVQLAAKPLSASEPGKVSDYLAISDCARDLQVGGNTIDLCEADFGQSYLLVLNQDGKQLLLRE